MRALLAAVVTGVLAVAAQPALAANGPSPGVHIDPRSPAGKQYQIPIISVRGETSGGSHTSGSGAPPRLGRGSPRPARPPGRPALQRLPDRPALRRPPDRPARRPRPRRASHARTGAPVAGVSPLIAARAPPVRLAKSRPRPPARRPPRPTRSAPAHGFPSPPAARWCCCWAAAAAWRSGAGCSRRPVLASPA